jgi:hypothetical protein
MNSERKPASLFAMMEPAGYVVASCAAAALSDDERARCLRLISEGGAVNARTAARDFPRSAMIAVARKDAEIVGVASIKPLRADYAAGIAKKAKFAFDPNTPELGYAVVDAPHRGKRLSSQMADTLFATTSAPAMKLALNRAGFVQRGIEWKGLRGDMLSLWIRS